MFHTILTHAPTLVNRVAATFLVLALAVSALPAAAASGVVNVNTADESQLTLLPRIGPSIAGRIVEFREENGPIEAKEDLMLVRGIGEKTFELLEPFVVTKGDTTHTEKVRPSDVEASRSEPEGHRR
jgi:competence protein ComEA